MSVDQPTAGIHHVQMAMPAGGENAARAFYANLLGLIEIEKPPLEGFARFYVADPFGNRLELLELPEAAGETTQPWTERHVEGVVDTGPQHRQCPR